MSSVDTSWSRFRTTVHETYKVKDLLLATLNRMRAGRSCYDATIWLPTRHSAEFCESAAEMFRERILCATLIRRFYSVEYVLNFAFLIEYFDARDCADLIAQVFKKHVDHCISGCEPKRAQFPINAYTADGVALVISTSPRSYYWPSFAIGFLDFEAFAAYVAADTADPHAYDEQQLHYKRSRHQRVLEVGAEMFITEVGDRKLRTVLRWVHARSAAAVPIVAQWLRYRNVPRCTFEKYLIEFLHNLVAIRMHESDGTERMVAFVGDGRLHEQLSFETQAKTEKFICENFVPCKERVCELKYKYEVVAGVVETCPDIVPRALEFYRHGIVRMLSHDRIEYALLYHVCRQLLDCDFAVKKILKLSHDYLNEFVSDEHRERWTRRHQLLLAQFQTSRAQRECAY